MLSDEALRFLIVECGRIPERLIDDLAAANLNLTEREEHTLHLAALGHSMASTAEACGVSIETIDKRHQRIASRLGTRTIAESLAALARQRIAA